MLAENLVDMPSVVKPLQIGYGTEQVNNSDGEGNKECTVGSSKDSGRLLGFLHLQMLILFSWFLEKFLCSSPVGLYGDR